MDEAQTPLLLYPVFCFVTWRLCFYDSGGGAGPPFFSYDIGTPWDNSSDVVPNGSDEATRPNILLLPIQSEICKLIRGHVTVMSAVTGLEVTICPYTSKGEERIEMRMTQYTLHYVVRCMRTLYLCLLSNNPPQPHSTSLNPTTLTSEIISTRREHGCARMEKFLRDWRQDALNKAQYEAAIFVGDKLLALTNDDKDAFWLAQVHFATGNYTRAQTFLSKQDLISRNPSCRYLAGHCLIKQSRYEEALNVLGDLNPVDLFNLRYKRKVQPKNGNNKPSSSRARGLSALSRDSQLQDEVEEEDEEEALNRKYEAAMCYLRGICYAKQNAFDRAKECYKDAVRIDVQCFEAFHQLMANSLLSPDEEWQFLDALDFDSINVSGNASASQEAAEFTKMLYTTQLSKYRDPSAFATAYDSLSTHYRLADNPDLLLARADLLYTQCRYQDALAITDSILQDDKYNFTVYPLHLACLFELGRKNALFLVAHDLADNHPGEPCSWLAVGIYYFSIDKIAEARRYFSKASMMDAHFGPAWIGFAHTFAAEGEHDQAISAYSTAARLFMGTHLPQVFLGMQNHALNNMTLAEEFLKTAYGLCKTDPLLLNEMGVVKYHQGKPDEAVQFFVRALEIADEIDADPDAWLAARTNLAHAYRRLRRHREALAEFNEVLRLGGKDAAVLCAKGLIYLEDGQPEKAIVPLHEALAVNPQDSIATELLNKALDESACIDIADDEDLESFESELDLSKARARDKVAARGQPVNWKAKGKGRGESSVGRCHVFHVVSPPLSSLSFSFCLFTLFLLRLLPPTLVKRAWELAGIVLRKGYEYIRSTVQMVTQTPREGMDMVTV
ncbi:hypothetical protein ACRALDRAFT_205421 [Sodiomyces alcalophilus JCM 7366]|uniref:uncharacterized protein n=1 Tax=Sodiomyces alcalophilus JCM 7366 TaxID=591952 RepID=UPI0039B64721